MHLPKFQQRGFSVVRKILDWFKRPVVQEPRPEIKKPGVFSTDPVPTKNIKRLITEKLEANFNMDNSPFIAHTPGTAMDSFVPIKSQFTLNQANVPDSLLLWYASQTFIGYQLSAMFAQHWLVSKACLMPAKDATRNGYEITVNDGTEVKPEVLDALRKLDVKYKLNKNLIEFIHMGRVFGIRVCKFVVESDDPDYYRNPFNPDGVKPGSYKGMSQIDPYWIIPQLDNAAAGDPAAIDFYEPTWWNINGEYIHRTHLVIFKTEEVADLLKPTYIYGGIPIPQKIYERVYAAERTANEAPMLALTKRTDVLQVDMTESVAQEYRFNENIANWIARRDNYGIKTVGLEEDMKQFDTSLTDLDAVIMTQYQIVAAAANVPATKLLGTSPKGFNTTGEFEEASYHEELESLQTHDLQPLIERHHLLCIRSEICPRFNIAPFETTIEWNPLDAMTAKEQSELNKLNAETGAQLINNGAIDPAEERQRIINDPQSGYSGLVDETPDIEIENDPRGEI
jgi:phage-related protein (TIGR01555 family)